MYLEHFALRELPFAITPDSSFFFAYGHYRQAYNTLLIALQAGEGFVKVIGEVGTGKSLLCRKLLNSLGEGYHTCFIPNPRLTAVALVHALAEELGMDTDANIGLHRILKEINRRLIDLNGSGRRVVMLIDEAQAMPKDTLEALRLLSNLETEKSKLLHVVLFGQPELDHNLSDPAYRQIKQRITYGYYLDPIDREGMVGYISHRLQIASLNRMAVVPQFERRSYQLLYRGSQGVPRMINILSHKALLAAWGEGSQRISPHHVRAAINDTEGAFHGTLLRHLFMQLLRRKHR
jgi:MSHA biogenesis protein MshM